MAKTIQIIRPNGKRTFASFVQDNKVICTQAYDCKLRSIPDDQAEAMLLHIATLLSPAYKLTILDFDEVKKQALREHPVCKVINDTTTAKRFPMIKPWHHLHFQDNRIFGIVWDTRHLDFVLSLADFTDNDFANLQFVYDDNYMPVELDADMHISVAEWKQSVSMPTTMTDKQFNLIRGRK